jgi:hypothetical protein
MGPKVTVNTVNASKAVQSAIKSNSAPKSGGGKVEKDKKKVRKEPYSVGGSKVGKRARETRSRLFGRRDEKVESTFLVSGLETSARGDYMPRTESEICSFSNAVS